MEGVGEAIRLVRSGSPPEQLESTEPIKIKRRNFFMGRPYSSGIERRTMRDGSAATVHNGAAQAMQIHIGRDKLELKPCILELLITGDLTQVERIEIRAAVIIEHDGASAPIRVARAVFILQTIPKGNIL